SSSIASVSRSVSRRSSSAAQSSTAMPLHLPARPRSFFVVNGSILARKRGSVKEKQKSFLGSRQKKRKSGPDGV
ncbi:hypothetical protein, partial [Dysosmobacter sp.]|uniref:hypothetical protein n=1 Tax=Dysosmobacter sp. TaxID=2591382 RepID=UPI00307DB724